MEVTSYFGFACPKCKSSVDIGTGEPNCPWCGTKMEANPDSAPVRTNAHCKKCNATYGLINSDICPLCETKFE